MLSIFLLVSLAAGGAPVPTSPSSAPATDVPRLPAPTKPPLRVAAPGFTGLNVKPDLLHFFTEHASQQLGLQGVSVVTPAQISAIVGMERQKQLMGCSEAASNCLTELAAALGVDALLIGDTSKVGKSFHLNLKLINANSGEVLALASSKASAEEAVADELTVLAKTLANGLAVKTGRKLEPVAAAPRGPEAAPKAALPKPKPRPAGPPARTWPLTTGLVAAGGMGAVAGLFYVASWGYHADLTDPDTRLSYAEALETRNGQRAAEFLGLSSLVAGAGALGLGLLFYRGEPSAPRASVALSSSGGVLVLEGPLP